jgi:hypothetical protein
MMPSVAPKESQAPMSTMTSGSHIATTTATVPSTFSAGGRKPTRPIVRYTHAATTARSQDQSEQQQAGARQDRDVAAGNGDDVVSAGNLEALLHVGIEVALVADQDG